MYIIKQLNATVLKPSTHNKFICAHSTISIIGFESKYNVHSRRMYTGIYLHTHIYINTPHIEIEYDMQKNTMPYSH